MKFLILGSKEFPVGSGSSFDSLPSGGMETYTQGLAKALKDLGEKVVVVTRKFGDGQATDSFKGIEVRRVGWLKGFFLRNPTFNLNAFLEARKVNYDVCVCNGVMATLAGIALRKLKKKPVIARPAGIAHVQPQYNSVVKKLLKTSESYAYSHADAVVFLSEEEKTTFQQKMGFLPKKHVVIPTGIDLEKFSSVSGDVLRLKYGSPLVVFVGRLMEVKGVSFLLEAMKTVDAKLVIAGEGPEEVKLKKMVVDYGLSDKVFFVGTVKNVAELLAAADVFVLPSLSEGLPVTMLEAMACSRSCVLTDIGLPVKNEETALLVPPKDSVALAGAINRLLFDSPLREKIGENAYAHVRKNFRWDYAAKSYVRLAVELIE